MRGLAAVLLADIQIQWRNGFYKATVFVLIFVFWGLYRVSRFDWDWLLPIAVLLYINVSAFYFVGAMVFFEKEEGIFAARAVSPASPWQYFLSKFLSLSILIIIESLPLVLLIGGFKINYFFYLAGILTATALYVLFGFMAAVRYRSLEEYLLPSVLFGLIASLPLIFGLFGFEHFILFIHPVHASRVIFQGAFAYLPVGKAMLSVFFLIVSIGLLAFAAKGYYEKTCLSQLGTPL